MYHETVRQHFEKPHLHYQTTYILSITCNEQPPLGTLIIRDAKGMPRCFIIEKNL